MNERARSAEAESREKAARRPNVRRRRRRCQAYLLWARVRTGSVKAAIKELIDMQDADPVGSAMVVPDEWPLSEQTLRRYWRQIPIAVRIWAGTHADPGPDWEPWMRHTA